MAPEKFKVIVKYLYHSSPDAEKLSREVHNHLFSLGDGYGQMGLEWLIRNNLTWDWSHIRDSSDEALERIYKELVKLGLDK